MMSHSSPHNVLCINGGSRHRGGRRRLFLRSRDLLDLLQVGNPAARRCTHALYYGRAFLFMKQYLSPARRRFYRSAKWKKCRDGYYNTKNGICERCGGLGTQVHHRIYLTDENLKDPTVALNWENLELLCDKCHAEEHHGGGFQTAEGLRFNEEGDLIENAREETDNVQQT